MSRLPGFLSPRSGQQPSGSRHRSSISTAGLTPQSTPSQRDSRRNSSAHVESESALRGVRRFEARRNMEESQFLSHKARISPRNSPVDFRLLDYVTNVDENLVCPICRCPFVDPVVLAECDHCFCRDCIRQSWASTYTPLGPRGDCPSCRTPAKLGPRSATSKIVVNILDDLVVKCPKHSDGCQSEVKRGEVQDHVALYCLHGVIDCPAEKCDLPILRKDSLQGCLHYGVTCIDCHQSMLQAGLEQHWRKECPDRKIHCQLCDSAVFYRNIDDHNKESCPAISVPCPGREYGCDIRSKRGEADAHAKTCALAKLAPLLDAQKQRLDAQETAQRQMSRKLVVLEGGLGNLQRILGDRPEDVDSQSADEGRIPLLTGHGRQESFMTAASTPLSGEDQAVFWDNRNELGALTSSVSGRPTSSMQQRSLPSTAGMPIDFEMDFDTPSHLPPPAARGPYASPLHHLLSMHESLRDEMTRISAAVQELDGRHSMQILNENLRTREEIAYLGGQVAGVNRQVHWLTSAQLQRQQGRAVPSSSGSAGEYGDIAGAGAGVEAAVSAVNTAATALRGAVRMVSMGRDGPTMRRGSSEEGRTKL